MNADEQGRRRYRLFASMVWFRADQDRFMRAALEAFPGSVEVAADGVPLRRPTAPDPQLGFE